MKIAFVFDDSLDAPDGIQQYMLSLHKWFTSQGHEVHFLVGETKRTDIPNVYSLSKNVRVKFNGNYVSIPLFGSKQLMREVLARERYDVLHVQAPYHPYMAGWVMQAAHPNMVVFGTFHIAPYSALVSLAARFQALLSKPSQKRFNTVVSVSPTAQKMAKQIYNIDSEVIPNVFDYHRFHDAEPLPQFNDDVKTVLFLGRLVERKGCMSLLKAVNALQHDVTLKLPPYRVVLCGGGPLEAELKKYVQQQNLQDIVSFEGRVSEEDKPRYFASADISVFPSSGGESFGIVLIEAMASGRAAVLGGDNPGYHSVMAARPEQLFAARDTQALKQKLANLLTDDSARIAAAKWGEKESAQYEVSKVGAQLLAAYQSVAPNSNSES